MPFSHISFMDMDRHSFLLMHCMLKDQIHQHNLNKSEPYKFPLDTRPQMETRTRACSMTLNATNSKTQRKYISMERPNKSTAFISTRFQ